MAKLLRRLTKRRNAAPTGQPEQLKLESEDEEPRMKPTATLVALYSYSARNLEDLAFEKG